jgi:hypothetical protein
VIGIGSRDGPGSQKERRIANGNAFELVTDSVERLCQVTFVFQVLSDRSDGVADMPK